MAAALLQPALTVLLAGWEKNHRSLFEWSVRRKQIIPDGSQR